MAWFKVAERMMAHPVSAQVGDAALGYWMRLGCWLAQYPKEGDRIPHVVAIHLLYGTPRRKLKALIDAGMLTPSGDSYILHGALNLGGSGLIDPMWKVETPPDARRKIPAELRVAIYERDGYACLECGSVDDLTLDHIWPWSRGGQDTYENLRTLCRPCNSAKGARV